MSPFATTFCRCAQSKPNCLITSPDSPAVLSFCISMSTARRPVPAISAGIDLRNRPIKEMSRSNGMFIELANPATTLTAGAI